MGSLTSSSVGTTRFPKTGSQWVTKSAASFLTTPSAGAMASAPLRISSAHLCPTSASTDSLSPKTWRTTSSRCARLILNSAATIRSPRSATRSPTTPSAGRFARIGLRWTSAGKSCRLVPPPPPVPASPSQHPVPAPRPAGRLHHVWSEEEEAVRGEARGFLRFPEEGQAVPPHALERGHVLDVRQEEAL